MVDVEHVEPHLQERVLEGGHQVQGVHPGAGGVDAGWLVLVIGTGVVQVEDKELQLRGHDGFQAQVVVEADHFLEQISGGIGERLPVGVDVADEPGRALLVGHQGECGRVRDDGHVRVVHGPRPCPFRAGCCRPGPGRRWAGAQLMPSSMTSSSLRAGMILPLQTPCWSANSIRMVSTPASLIRSLIFFSSMLAPTPHAIWLLFREPAPAQTMTQIDFTGDGSSIIRMSPSLSSPKRPGPFRVLYTMFYELHSGLFNDSLLTPWSVKDYFLGTPKMYLQNFNFLF